MGGGPVDDPKLTGMARYFNGTTISGRANVRTVHPLTLFSETRRNSILF